jgi:hypothetical protein
MTTLQRKFIESRLVIVALFVMVTIFQDNAWLARAAFAAALLYAWANVETLKRIDRTGPTPAQILASSALTRYWLATGIVAEAAIAYYFLFSGKNLGQYLGFGSLLLAFLFPIAPAAYLSQRELFRKLQNARP